MMLFGWNVRNGILLCYSKSGSVPYDINDALYMDCSPAVLFKSMNVPYD
jgi:hypothetical protein